jgi:hypothetical protein
VVVAAVDRAVQMAHMAVIALPEKLAAHMVEAVLVVIILVFIAARQVAMAA